MRKIIITDHIRSFAKAYADEILRICPNVIRDLEKLRDNVVNFNPGIIGNVAKEYIDSIISDYPDILITEPKDWDLKKYDDILKKDYNILTSKVKYKVKKNDPTGKPIEYYEDDLYKRIMFCLRYSDARIILGDIHQKMNLKACVYCNTQPTRSARGKVFYEMDHLKPQSKYPFLGTCFYNLQPSDATCNKNKLTKPCDFQLYVNDTDEELSPFKFLPQVIEIAPEKGAECIEIRFIGSGGKETIESEQHKNTFHLDSLYHAYRDKVEELYERNYKIRRKVYEASYGFTPSKSDIIDFLIDFPYDESVIHGDTLRKLKIDTIKQLDDADLLTT